MDPAQHRPEVLPSSAPASEPRDERPSHDAIWGWHFLHDSGVLGYGDGRRVKAGGTLSVDLIEGSPLRGHKLGVSAARQWVGGDHPGVRVPSS